VIELCIQHLQNAPRPLAARGVTAPPELEALVLACLEKEPDRRPQSAAELRRKLEACVITPWTSDDARAWWLEHQVELASEQPRGDEPRRTVAILGGR
jgi:serine/threonine-protein kinase